MFASSVSKDGALELGSVAKCFKVRRMKDPTGMLPLLCELQVGSSGVNVVDVHTGDQIFAW